MMLRVKDESGNIIAGLFKDSLGNLVVNDNKAYNAYLKSRQQSENINNLTKQVAELKDLIDRLLSASINKDGNEHLETNNG